MPVQTTYLILEIATKQETLKIKIEINFIFRLHHCTIQLVVFVPVRLSSVLLHRRQVLLGFKVSSVAWPGQVTAGVQITYN